MSPVFAHGQLRLYLLALLAERPRHGYEVIQDLETRFNGLYSPSAGTVYPRLAKLEEEGLVERTVEGRKTVYRITGAGRREVAERAGDVAALEADLEHSVRQLAEEVRANVSAQSRDLRAELKAAARSARAHATPAGGSETSWAAYDSGTVGDLERAVAELRVEARQAWKRRGLTSTQVSDVVRIVTDATRQIRDVVAAGR
ncbi:MAG: PadR family transcriptional regulator [Nostocoides sp.]